MSPFSTRPPILILFPFFYSLMETCSGGGADRCFCRRFIQRPNQDPNRRAKCRDCRHLEGCCPTDSQSISSGHLAKYQTQGSSSIVDSIIQKYRDDSLNHLLPKVSAQAARKETNAGFRTHHDAATAEGSSTSLAAPWRVGQGSQYSRVKGVSHLYAYLFVKPTKWHQQPPEHI